MSYDNEQMRDVFVANYECMCQYQTAAISPWEQPDGAGDRNSMGMEGCWA